MESKYKKLGMNAMIFAIGTFSQKILSFLFVPFYTAVLTTSDYGTADLVLTVCSMLWPLLTLMIDEGVLRFCLDNDIEKEHIVSIGMYFNIFGFFILLIFSPVILFVEALKANYILFILYYFAYTVANFFSYTLRGLGEIKKFTVSGIINTILTITLNLFFLLELQLGIRGYLLSFIIAYIGTGIFQFFSVKLYRYIILPKKLDRFYCKKMLNYSVPLIPNSISWWISNSSDRLIVTAVCGVAANGIYSVAYKIPSLITVCSGIFSNAWQISAIDGYGTESNRKFFSNIYLKYSSCSTILVSVIVFVNKYICRFLFSKGFYEAWRFAPILVFAVSFQIISGFLGTIYTTAKNTKMIFISTIVAASANIILNLYLIPLWGETGAAIATCFSYFLIWSIRIVDSRKIMILDVEWKTEVVVNILILIEVVVSCSEYYFELPVNLIIVVFIVLLRRNFLKSIWSLITVKIKA